MGVNTGGLRGDDDLAQVERFISQTGITFPVGLDATNSHTQFRAGPRLSPFPIDVLLDAEGRIQLLSFEYDAEALDAAIETLLAAGTVGP